jgi:hypothetical protein
MATGKGNDPLSAWREFNRREMQRWLEPKSGDLLLDVSYLQQRVGNESKPKIKGVYARATIVMAAVTIEAMTNDALSSIYELLADCIPSECSGEPPWCYFRGESKEQIAALLKKGSFKQKRDYVLTQVGRPEEDLIQAIDQIMKLRNSIVHMRFQERPDEFGAFLSTKEVSPLAKQAWDAARQYLDFLSFAFDEMNLPHPTIRPHGHFDDDLKSK